MSLPLSDKQNIWHPYTRIRQGELNIVIEKTEGAYLFDSDGKRYIDAIGSWWVNLHGHGHPAIVKAIANQAAKLDHIMFAGFTHPPAIKLAEMLLEVLPAGFSKVFYSDNGSTAVEIALKMCFQYWHNKGRMKSKVIALENAYHGDTFGAMSVGGRSIFTQAFEPFLFDVEFISIDDGQNVVESFKNLVEKGNVACFIFEPLVQGAAGMNIYPAAVLDELLSLAKANNVLCIADEVFTGFGRTGKYFSIDHLQNKVDIICLSKGLSGGVLPLGATVCREEIFQAFAEESNLLNDGEGLNIRTFFHGHSFTANPIACAAAIASLELLKSKECTDSISRIEKQNQEFVQKIRSNSYPTISTARCLGIILAVEYTTSEQTGYLNQIRDKLYVYFIDKGIVLRPLGNIVYIVPPNCISDEDLAFVYEAILSFQP